jgi:hypothetical protein
MLATVAVTLTTLLAIGYATVCAAMAPAAPAA